MAEPLQDVSRSEDGARGVARKTVRVRGRDGSPSYRVRGRGRSPSYRAKAQLPAAVRKQVVKLTALFELRLVKGAYLIADHRGDSMPTAADVDRAYRALGQEPILDAQET